MNKNSKDIKKDSIICFGRIIKGIYTLGPGSRTCFWLQGCSKGPKCTGCTTPEYQSFNKQSYISTQVVADCLRVSNKNGRLTISGGEPLDQPVALHKLLCLIRNDYKDILLYTGKLIKELDNNQKKILELVDVVIDGPYEQSHDNNCILRGSNNQGIHFTPRCTSELKKEYDDYIAINTKRKIQFIPYTDCIIEVGIPTNHTQEGKYNDEKFNLY